jgi:biopolymer transport protein ExbD
MGPPTLRSEISVTPLVDVCLVLLIIFMVITPFCVNGDVLLPLAQSPLRVPEKAVVLTLRADRGLLIDDTALARDALAAKLADLSAQGKRLAIKADRRLPYREVRALLAAASAAQFPGAGLVVKRRVER